MKDKLEYLLMALLCLTPIGIYFTLPKAEVETHSEFNANVNCLVGKCYVLRGNSIFLERISIQSPLLVPVGDILITLEDNTEAEVIFPDSSKLIQRGNSILEIKKGRASLIKDLNKQTPGMDSSDEKKDLKVPIQKVVYVGKIPLEVLQPQPGSEIIPLNDKKSFKMVLRRPPNLTANSGNSDEFKRWKIYLVDEKDGKIRFEPIKTIELVQISGSETWGAEISVDQLGELALVPEKLDPAIPNNGFRITLLPRSSLSEGIESLLENYEERRDKPLEIRSQ